MHGSIRWLALALLATASVWWLTGCTPTAPSHPATKTASSKDGDHKDHKGTEHQDGDHKDHKDGTQKGSGHDHKDGDHGDKALTEKDVKMPANFKEGVGRLEELNNKIDHHIEHGELDKVHRVAEEMALVAKKMKELAQKDVAEDKRADAGRLCNEVAGYYKPIDEAADAGKKKETEDLHKKMVEAVGKLKDLAK